MPRTLLRPLKNAVKRLPPLVKRDAKIAALRAQVNVLRKQVKGLGAQPEMIDGRGVSAAPPTNRQAALLRRSGLFDDGWYLEQLAATGVQQPDDLVEHYLESGYAEGLSAHPALPEAPVAERGTQGPRLLQLLSTRGPKDFSGFPAQAYAQAHPEAHRHPGGVFGHYLSGTGVAGDRSAHPWLDPEDFLDRVRTAARGLLAARGQEHLPRQSETFDHEHAARVKAELRQDPSLLREQPLVTVVLPTKDRAARLRSAIASVQAQTYPVWELIVVDDGSTEDLSAVLAEHAFDDRIRWLRHEVNQGVAAARNTALRQARGSYVAYLDSDNTWKADFLEILVRHAQRTGARVSYCASALVEVGGQGRRVYRGMPFHRQALRERNFIDCIVILHERSLLEEVGGFDEQLRRTVDWDLLIRMAEVTDFSYVPVIGTEYDLWEEGGDRITTDVAEGYRFRVRERTLVDWDRVRADLDQRTDRLSIVIAATQSLSDLPPVIERVRARTATAHEIIVVDPAHPPAAVLSARVGLADCPEVTWVHLPQRLTPELARNAGIAASTGRTVVVLHDRAWVTDGWEQPLLEALEHHVATQPVLLGQDGAVWSAGISFLPAGQAHQTFAGFAQDAPELRGTREVDALSGACLAARAADLAAVEGFDPLHLRRPTGPELSLRLRQHTGRPLACVGRSQVAFVADPPAATRAGTALDVEVQNAGHEQELWARTGREPLPVYADTGYRPTGYRRDPRHPGTFAPVLVHDRGQDRPLRWALKIGTYSVTDRESWGDWHFAHALRDALERLGHEATIDIRDSWYRPSSQLDDVTLFIQGRGRFLPTPGQVSVVWVYSHPGAAPVRDLAQVDLAFGASPEWVRRARAHARREPELMLQCTDPQRFHPTTVDPAARHELLMVGNARGLRPSVDLALQAGLEPTVYGKFWDGLVPDRSWAGDYLPNHELPTYYASAGAVLNDHWAEMRAWGLVSNRLFDAAACGARIISDPIDGLEEIFGDVVLTASTPEEMQRAVEIHRSETPERAEARLALAEAVRREHSFDARAARLSERVREVLAEQREDDVR